MVASAAPHLLNSMNSLKRSHSMDDVSTSRQRAITNEVPRRQRVATVQVWWFCIYCLFIYFHFQEIVEEDEMDTSMGHRHSESELHEDFIDLTEHDEDGV